MLNNTSILLVDDDPFILDMYVQKFEHAGYMVRSAKNAEEAYQQIQAEAPRVLLLDIMMPGMTGIELLQKLHDENLMSEIIVIMLTNQGSDEEMKKAQELGAKSYILKAMTIPSEVVAEVERIVGAN